MWSLLDQTPQQLAPVIAGLQDARLQDVVPVPVAAQTGDFRHELIHDGVLYTYVPVLQDALHEVVAACGVPIERPLSVLAWHSVQTSEFRAGR